jgi:cytochrome b subunit of formate dehydrogenase
MAETRAQASHEEHVHPDQLVRRFSPWTVATHAVLAVSVFGLVFTGMPLKFSTAFWAWPLIHIWGGPHMAGLFHRGFAVLFFISALMHVAGLVVAAIKKRFPQVFGPDSIVPGIDDVRQLRQDIRYLQGKADRPDFGRFTYMEKFDYLAEIWGIIVIGGSGLIMWFPVRAAEYLPGWVVNAALIFHSYEALLAAAFIFSIHFFNTHLRPEVFPVDEVIFSGVMPLHELEEDYPGWYRRMRDSGKLAARYVDEAAVSRKLASKISVVFLTLGVVMLLLIMWAALSQVISFIVELVK